MADIVIRGMEPPESCRMCDVQVLKHAVWHFGYGCKGSVRKEMRVLLDTEDDDDFCNCPPSYCPILDLPEGHGKLIDADELMNRARGCLDELTILSLEFLVNGSSTIVPAEGD